MTGFVDEHSVVVCGPWVIGGIVAADDTTHGQPAVCVRKKDGQLVWLPVKRLLRANELFAGYRGEWICGVGGGPTEITVGGLQSTKEN